MRTLRMLIVLLAAIVLAGCPPGAGSHTVRGTISCTDIYVLLADQAVVTVTHGSNSYSASVAIGPEDYSIQSAAYSLEGIPEGTYSVSIVVTTTTTVDIVDLTQNGSSLSWVFDNTNGPPTWILSADNIQIDSDSVIDATFARNM
jgi:hypothetical protein